MFTNGLPPVLEGALAPMTDFGNAERFTHQHKDTIRWCQVWKQWVIYNGTYWEKDAHGKIGAYAKKTIRSIYREAADIPSEDDRKKLIHHGLKSESSGAASAMLERAKSEMLVQPEQFNTQKHLLNCQNGTVNLMTGELHAHNSLDFLTSCANANYDPTADCPKWKAFLDAVFELYMLLSKRAR